MRVHPTGTVTVFTGSHSHGQGHETTFAQVVAFLSGITRIPKLMTLDDFTLEMTQNNTDQETPRLSAAGTLLGYRYVRVSVPAEAKPGDANGSTGNK